MPRHFEDAETMVAALEPEEPVYCLRPRIVAEIAERFLAAFPGHVLYAVKANPQDQVLDALHAAGIRHFDTASIGEVALIAERFAEATCYFMHPVKGPAAIRAAYHRYGVRHFVIDHGDELDKISHSLGGAPDDLVVVVRLATPAGGAVFDLSEKFGAAPAQAAGLMQAAAAAGYRPGLCFHVGSQCTRPEAFGDALALSGEVLATARVAPACLDVGGGFPTAYDGEPVPELDRFMAQIKTGLARLDLPAASDVMCEPGRALVAEAMSLVVQVQHRRGRHLYINDGIYGSLHGATVGVRHPARLLRPGGRAAPETAEFTIFGPTCDGLDVLPAPLVLPADTGRGDWIELDRIGAYSTALRTGFNGFLPDTVVTVDAPYVHAGQAGSDMALGACTSRPGAPNSPVDLDAAAEGDRTARLTP